MKYKVTLNNRVYEVEVEAGEAMLVDEYELAAPAAPAAPVSATILTTPSAPAAAASAVIAAGEMIKSPMPGNILKVLVSKGQSVKEGDVLMILEAMKMENEIVAHIPGTVADVLVEKGTVVETGTVLAVIG